MNTKAYLAEAIGAFLLTLAVSGSIISEFGLSTPLVAGLTLGICVYWFGSISGAHLNPSITLMLWLQKKMTAKDSVFYIIAQLLGAAIAGLLVVKMYGQAPAPEVVSNGMVFFAEILGTFCLGMGVSAVANGKVTPGASGLTVGASLLLGILLAFKVSNGVLNPAVAFGINSVSLIYILGPVVGAGLAGLTYPYLMTQK